MPVMDDGELAGIVVECLAEGLRQGKRSWYLPASDSAAPVRDRLEARHVNVPDVTLCARLRILSVTAAYDVRGDFDPEER
jgi:hypothetical protein